MAAGGLADRVARALAAALVSSGGVPERGIDISAYQNANGPINWRELARHGIRFVVIKASEDTYYANPYYLPDARAASRAGLAVLAYAFANPAGRAARPRPASPSGPRTTGAAAARCPWSSIWRTTPTRPATATGSAGAG